MRHRPLHKQSMAMTDTWQTQTFTSTTGQGSHSFFWCVFVITEAQSPKHDFNSRVKHKPCSYLTKVGHPHAGWALTPCQSGLSTRIPLTRAPGTGTSCQQPALGAMESLGHLSWPACSTHRTPVPLFSSKPDSIAAVTFDVPRPFCEGFMAVQ